MVAKQAGERRAGNPHAAFDHAGAGNVARWRCCDTRERKGEPTGNTNVDLNQRARSRPYLEQPVVKIPPADSPNAIDAEIRQWAARLTSSDHHRHRPGARWTPAVRARISAASGFGKPALHRGSRT